MPLPKTPDGQIDVKKVDDILTAMLTLLDVQNRQIVAMGNIVIALKSDGPATFQLPDPPAELLEKMEALKQKT
jgi:hypothetical protein